MTPLREIAERLADGLWDTISGDCFGMTPDPWVCDERQTCNHRCRDHTRTVADAIEAAFSQAQAEREAEGGCTHAMVGQVLSGAIVCRECGQQFELRAIVSAPPPAEGCIHVTDSDQECAVCAPPGKEPK